jgi:hypothetical protein
LDLEGNAEEAKKATQKLIEIRDCQ